MLNLSLLKYHTPPTSIRERTDRGGGLCAREREEMTGDQSPCVDNVQGAPSPVREDGRWESKVTPHSGARRKAIGYDPVIPSLGQVDVAVSRVCLGGMAGHAG